MSLYQIEKLPQCEHKNEKKYLHTSLKKELILDDSRPVNAIKQSRTISEFKLGREELGKADTLRYNVLTFVIEENYERAAKELKKFLETDFEYPNLHQRIERYILHCIDLINAIRVKRSFPGSNMLTMAKQRELNEKFILHLQELQMILKKVEEIQHDTRIADIRSTVIVVKTFAYCLIALAVAAFIMDIQKGLLTTAITVTDDMFQELVNWVFKKIS